MNETCIPGNNGCAVREDGQRLIRARCDERDGTCFIQQRIGEYIQGGVSSTLMARDYKSASDLVVEPIQRKYIVRRLTPTECARLQGFPDLWCEGLGGSDSAIYKAYGNGLALPCAYDVLHRIAKYIKEENT